jgi:hypothetical protein
MSQIKTAGCLVVREVPELLPPAQRSVHVLLLRTWPVAVSSLLRTRRVGSEHFHWIGRALAEYALM